MNNTMLIVDDVEANRAILKVLFEENYDIIEAESAQEALEFLQACAGNIDIMLLDVIMPGMSGVEMLQNYRSMSYLENIPVVIITASERMEDQLEAFQAGANDFITKPFLPEIVTTRVENVMASSRRILDIQKEKEELKVQSELDQMTGLYNKATAKMAIMSSLSLYPRGIHVMMMIDIDNFKSVNDNEGHVVGDQTIKVIANQIMSLFRKTDVMSRFGGDEFCVFMCNLPSKEIARKKAQELALLMKYKPNLTIPANVSVSVGLAFTDRENLEYDELLQRADEALYDAKKFGKARVYEYGQTSASEDLMSKDAVLLLSRNRNVCSNVQAAMGFSHAICECGTLERIGQMEDQIRQHLVLSFIDISEETDHGETLLREIKMHHSWILDHPFICTYKEGELEQVRMALMAGTADIMQIPFDIKAVQRVMEKHIKEKCIEE